MSMSKIVTMARRGSLLLQRTKPAASMVFSTSMAGSPDEFVRSTDIMGCVRYAKDVVAEYEVFSLLNQDGTVRDSEAPFPDKTPDEWREIYTYMIRLKELDEVMLASQRQGRISFYMTATGEEAIHIGSASAIKPEDTVLAQYREQGVLLWRGASIQQLADQCFSNEADTGKGRQMPVHYGSKAHNFQTISSPLGTQLPQAVGVAYSHKLDKSGNIAVCYFGEGAASEGDFHAALNMSSTLEAPMVFFVRNNGYAISTPAHEQFRGNGIASRAIGYDMPAIRVDGNDIAAVCVAMSKACEIAREQQRPVLVEAMTYRVGHHSTSDDSTRYRSVDEINQARQHDPIERTRNFLIHQGWWDSATDEKLRETERRSVLQALEIAERRDKPSPLTDLFSDVYDKLPTHLEEQQAEFIKHLEKYPDHGSAH